MSHFEIIINEQQRQYILTALNATRRHGYLGADKEGREEIDILTSLFADLKDDDSNYWVDPKDGKRKHMTHGFCL